MNHLQKAREIMDRIDVLLAAPERYEVSATDVLVDMTQAQTHAQIDAAQSEREIADAVKRIEARS